MVLAYLGLSCTQDQLARQLDLRRPLGAPASNLIHLRSEILDATLGSGDIDELRSDLAPGTPPTVFVRAAEFPYWHGQVSQHAHVVGGADERSVHVLDPAAGHSPIAVSIGDFILGWGEMNYLCATLVREWFCRSKRDPLDSRKGDHLTIEKGNLSGIKERPRRLSSAGTTGATGCAVSVITADAG